MSLFYSQTGVDLYLGDCVEVMREMSECSVDAVVADPPYFLSFMGRKWDTAPRPQDQQLSHEVWAREALRVLKPGGYLLAFGGTRTYHRLACAVEDAGFEIKDTIQWIYGSGFPKSKSMRDIGKPELGSALKPAHEPIVMARKPLSESSIARQVLQTGTGALNIDACRVSTTPEDVALQRRRTGGVMGEQNTDGIYGDKNRVEAGNAAGRWPANLLLSHHESCQRIGTKRVRGQNGGGMNRSRGANNVYGKSSGHPEVDEVGYAGPDGLEEVESWECARDEDGHYLCPVALLNEQGRNAGVHDAGAARKKIVKSNQDAMYSGYSGERQMDRFGDTGGPSRFFQQFHEPDTGPGFYYCAKSSRPERNKGLEEMPERTTDDGRTKSIDNPFLRGETQRQNSHPTVKPLALTRWLVRLVAPPGGMVLDPFLGSGTTGVACVELGFDFVGIEQDESYLEIAAARIAHAGKEEQPKPRVPRPAEGNIEAQTSLFEEGG